MAGPVEFLTLCGLAGGGAYWLWRRSPASKLPRTPKFNLRASGYVPPVDWVWRKYPKHQIPGQPTGPAEFNLARPDLMRERGSMPSCMVYYRPSALDARAAPDHWLSVMDGNANLDPPDHKPRSFVQTLVVSGNEALVFKGHLRLWEISPETVALLNQGPRRVSKVRVVAHPSGEQATLDLTMGVPGGQFPPSEPASSGTEHGSSDWGSADDLAAMGAVPPRP